jgi:N-acetylglucosaminyldiphosphoundecaprenol N-acetyl-beta-D-mannosaminyltransferase
METARLLGFRIDNLNLQESLERIDELIEKKGSHLVVTLGVEMVMYCRKDPEYEEIVKNASLVVPDSVGILWGCKKKGFILKERVPGIEILKAAAKNAEKYPWRIFFLGGKPGIAEEAANKLKDEYPGFNVVGTCHGYFKDDDEVLKSIIKASPDIIFIAMGFPAQEKWFVKNREKLGDMVSIGVGGSFDVISGRVKRAPLIFQKLGLEWFYRLITQPERAGRMLALPRFMMRVLFECET